MTEQGKMTLLISIGRVARVGIGLVVLVLAAASASAQQAPSALAATPDVTQLPTGPVGQLPAQVAAPHWAMSSGFEGDTHGTGYGFTGPTFHRPVSRNVMFVAGAGVNYLYYGFDSGARGRTSVTSPGGSATAGVRLGDRNWVQLQAGPGVKRRHEVVRDETDRIISSQNNVEVGLNLGADVWMNPSPTRNIQGMLQYGGEDRYTWGRIGFKQQITNLNWRSRFTHYLGTEYIGQGNHDIRSNQFGAFVELLHVPSSLSLMLRGGYKRSSFELGPAKTGPWYAVSLYKAFK